MSLRAETCFKQTAALLDWTSRRLVVAGFFCIQAANKLQDTAKRVRVYR